MPMFGCVRHRGFSRKAERRPDPRKTPSSRTSRPRESGEQPMDIPDRARRLAPVKAFAEQPVAAALNILDPKIVARGVAEIIPPPFRGDPLRPFHARHLVKDAPPAEAERRAFRHCGDDL